LPKHTLLEINSDVLSNCSRLSHEFSLYCAISKNIKKAFISIKGIYVTCELQSQEITWLMPYATPQKHVYDVDYNIMLSFLELYTSLLKFVNLKLFKDIGIDYPLQGDSASMFFGHNSTQINETQSNVSESFSEKKEKLNVKIIL
jgi:pescadillo protein